MTPPLELHESWGYCGILVILVHQLCLSLDGCELEQNLVVKWFIVTLGRAAGAATRTTGILAGAGLLPPCPVLSFSAVFQ